MIIALVVALAFTACGGDDDGGGGGPAKWTAVNSTFGTSAINAVTYANGKWVAVGANGKRAYSTNGTSWTAVNDSQFSTVTFNGIANHIYYGNGTFIAVGSSTIVYSDDGITWRSSGKATSSTANGIAYANDYSLAVCSNGGIVFTANFDDWHQLNYSTFGTSIIKAIAYGGGTWVAGGNAGKMAYSKDRIGSNWTAVADSTFKYGFINAIAYGNGKFVAGGTFGQMAYSSNGVTWTDVFYNSTNITWLWDDGLDSSGYYIIPDIKGIAYGNNRFVVVGDAGKMAYSSNGTSWTVVADSTFGRSNINAIAYGGGKFVAVGADGQMAYSNW